EQPLERDPLRARRLVPVSDLFGVRAGRLQGGHGPTLIPKTSVARQRGGAASYRSTAWPPRKARNLAFCQDARRGCTNRTPLADVGGPPPVRPGASAAHRWPTATTCLRVT